MPIRAGRVGGVRETLAQLEDILSGLGPVGTINVAPSHSGQVTIDVSESAAVSIHVPFTVDYAIKAGVVSLKFREPYPIGRYRGFARDVTFVDVTPMRIDVGIDWAPDIFFEVLS